MSGGKAAGNTRGGCSMTGAGYKDRSDFEKKLLENYDDIKEINTSGGGGIIYSAIHRRLGKKVVLKKIRGDKLDILGRDREINILLNLKHTYLPRILDFWSYGSEVYTVMEFIEGRSLKELLDEGRRFTEKEVVRLTTQLAEVLDYLHTSPLHIVHSDIKPANIMLTPENNICLIDFNISVLADSGSGQTIGYTAGYAPVEQLIGMEMTKRAMMRRPAAVDPDATVTMSPADIENETKLLDESKPYSPASYTAPPQVQSPTAAQNGYQRVPPQFPHQGGVQPQPAVQGVPQYQADSYNAHSQLSSNSVPPYQASFNTRPQPTPQSSNRQQPVEALLRKYGTGLRVDFRSDIYSACATAYHLLTGKKPEPCYMRQIPVERLVPNVNEALAKIIERGMAEDPADRFQSASELLKALSVIDRSSKKYKRARLVRDILIIFAVLAAAGAGALAFLNYRVKRAEEGDRLLAEADSLYMSGDIDEALKAVDKLTADTFALSDQAVAEAYYIEGSCFLELGEYGKAANSFSSAILASGDRAEYYRDYGISLARLGKYDLASECLSQAKAKGIDDESLLLLDGELSAAKGDIDEAVKKLENCVADCSGEMIRLRAGLRLDELIEEAKKDDPDKGLPLRTEKLSALDSLTGALRYPYLERLASVALECADTVGGEGYTLIAVDALKEIVDSQYSTISDSVALAVALQSLGRYSDAANVLTAANVKYPGSYEIYKRLAFLELDRQYSLPAAERDYADFAKYADESLSIYDKEVHTETDIEMDVLRRSRAEAVEKGWLDE